MRTDAPRLGGLRFTTAFVLALLGVPRVVLHDLHVIEEGTVVTAVLVLVLAAVWIATAVRRSASPFRALVAVGALHGVLLATTHQLLWGEVYEDGPPRLGGNLEGTFSDGTEELILRGSAVFSSVLIGIAMGAVTGLVAVAVSKARPGH